MVVKGFQRYLEENVPEVLHSANLKEIIKEELTCVNQPPTVVLDASAFCKSRGRNAEFDYFQPNVIKECMEEFVKSIISAGAYLIVVERGNVEKDVMNWYLKNKDSDKCKNSNFKQMKEKFENFDFIYTGEPLVQEIIEISLRFTKASNYKVFRSVDSTHKEVAKLARELNCLAIIGEDSNYLIYEGIRNYILTKSVNLKTLDCSVYDRNKVIEHLGLKPHHMPLFATLCGNDIVFAQNLFDFHKKITLLNKNKFLKIAKKVKHWEGDSYDHIKDVVNEVNDFRVTENLIKQSLDMYFNFEPTLSTNKWLLFANKLKKTFKWSNILYNIFVLKQFRQGKLYSLNTRFKFNDFLKPLRRKIYGILFFEDDDKTVAEYFFEDQNNDKFMRPTYVDAIEPECEHPGLMQLFDEKTPNVEYMRWNLFYSSISKTLKHSTIRSLPPALVIPALSFHYILNDGFTDSLKKIFIHQFEIEAFLIVAVLTHANADSAELKNSQKLKRPHFRPLILSLFYLDVCFTLKLLNETCGGIFSEESSGVYNFYDELLFHSVYEKMKNGTDWDEFFGEEILLKVLFSTLIDIVFN